MSVMSEVPRPMKPPFCMTNFCSNLQPGRSSSSLQVVHAEAMNADLEIILVDHSSAQAEQVRIMLTDMAVPRQVYDLMDVLGHRLGDLAFV